MKTFRILVVAVLAAVGHPALANDDFLGDWSGAGEGEVSASIRRGTANPDFFVIELGTGASGCGGSVTVFGRASGNLIEAESYDPSDPQAPICRVDLELVGRQALRTDEVEGCSYFHGAACGFSANLTRD